MHGGTGNYQLMGEGGNDTLFGDEGDDLLLGGQGNDLLIGGIGKDSLYGGEGDDEYIFSSGDGADYITDQEGQNLIRLDSVSTISSLEWMHASVNTSGAISYNQTGQDIVIRYGSGNVLVLSGAAAGNYTFQLGDGYVYNYIDFFDSGNEYQHYEGGNDSISCGDSNDRIYAGGGNDTVHGLGGNDAISGGNSFSNEFVALLRQYYPWLPDGFSVDWSGGDSESLVNNNDELYGDDGNDILEGGVGIDQLFGGNGDDALSGGDDIDSLYGEDGDDFLSGGADGDMLDGGAGNDRMESGTGDDLLRFDEGRLMNEGQSWYYVVAACGGASIKGPDCDR